MVQDRDFDVVPLYTLFESEAGSEGGIEGGTGINVGHACLHSRYVCMYVQFEASQHGECAIVMACLMASVNKGKS